MNENLEPTMLNTCLSNAKQEPAHPITAKDVIAYLEQQCDLFGFAPSTVQMRLTGTGISFALSDKQEPAQRCNCCGYLVTDSDHKGCLRAANKEPAQAVPEPLTDEQIFQIAHEAKNVKRGMLLPVTFARLIEKHHGIGAGE